MVDERLHTMKLDISDEWEELQYTDASVKVDVRMIKLKALNS